MLLKSLILSQKSTARRLRNLANNANYLYKTYNMLKKNSKDLRKIEQPSKELQEIQRAIINLIFKKMPIHHAATAYKNGASISKNAKVHTKTNFTNRYDFANFFPSFTENDIKKFLRLQQPFIDIALTQSDLDFIGKIVCRYGRLTIGSPSSPWITNAMMYQFDSVFSGLCRIRKLVYTRYADDIFVSAYRPDALYHLDKDIIGIINKIPYLSIKLKKEKTLFLSRKYKRTITGVNITPERKLSIGRDRKREIKSLIFQHMGGLLNDMEVNRLKGLLGFAQDVESSFIKALSRKYGADSIDNIFRE